MASTRETALEGLYAVLQGLSGPTVERNVIVPQEVPVDGLLILRDGEPGEPDISFSPTLYSYEHRAEVDVIVQAGAVDDRQTDLDDLMADIAAAIAADRTLGGTVDYARTEAPQTDDLAIEGAADIRAAIVPVILHYDTSDPLA